MNTSSKKHTKTKFVSNFQCQINTEKWQKYARYTLEQGRKIIPSNIRQSFAMLAVKERWIVKR
jgi:hypothetical protein